MILDPREISYARSIIPVPQTRSSSLNWLRFPILAGTSGPLTVANLGRFSTDEQNRRSATDQHAFNAAALEAQYSEPVRYIALADEGISGELRSRPGIEELLRLIANREVELILAEDASRIYRDEEFILHLMRRATDAGIRVLCINDFIDTADEDQWEDRVRDAMQCHAVTNRHTSMRIKRSQRALFEMGAALGLCRAGYLRRPTYPATQRTPEQGPFFDEIDPRWQPIIVAAYERTAAGEPAWKIAEFLTAQGLPKVANSRRKEWTDGNVNSLIRNEVYRGTEPYRIEISRRQRTTGARVSVPNTPSEIQRRLMPHLRIVSDAMWHQANDVITARTTRAQPPTGRDHPLHGIPRNTGGPLSTLFFCESCGGVMHAEGRNEGGYRCANARWGRCWNKTTGLRALTHHRIAQAILAELPGLTRHLEEVLGTVQNLLVNDDQRAQRQQELERRREELLATLSRLAAAVASSRQPLQTLVPLIAEGEHELQQTQSQLDLLQQEARSGCTLEELRGSLREFEGALQRMDRETQAWLKRTVVAIRAVPCQQFASNKVVLRARFEIQVAGFLPAATMVHLRNLYSDQLAERLGTIPITVDLFDPSISPKYGLQAAALSDAGFVLDAIAKRLGISKRAAHLAVHYGRAMRVAGIIDPFIELTTAPAAASRWRNRKRPR